MFGNRPDWSDDLAGIERLRAIVNALTRVRYCSVDGRIDFKAKDAPDPDVAIAPSVYRPWFDAATRATRGTTIVFGHWSTLGLLLRENVIGLDSGCVWGGQLSAVCLDDRSLLQVDCPQYKQHSGKQKN